MLISWIDGMLKKRTHTASRAVQKGRGSHPRRKVCLEVFQLESRLTPSTTDVKAPIVTDPLQNINHFIVIYQENWSFDSLYGLFPGANGLANSSATSLNQLDRLNGNPLSGETVNNPAFTYDPATLQSPPPGLDSNNNIDPRFLTNPLNPSSPTKLNTLLPYNAAQILPDSALTGDLVHRFWTEQSQINHGANNQFITWSDNPGLVMSYFDATNLPEGLLAQQYTLDDNFFHAAFGGSFLNHQFLVAAQAPVYPNAPSSLQPVLDSTGQLARDPVTGKIIRDGKITPIGSASFADPGQTFNQNYAVNTIYSKNLAPDFIGNNTSTGLLPSLNDSNPSDPTRPYVQTIGDTLDAAGVSWKWYSGGWNNALLGSPSNPADNGKTPANDPADPLFQWHHQPLAYYDNFAPWLPNGQRNSLSAAHLQDETNFFLDLKYNNLPAVSFIKQIGQNNEHPGYTDLLTGQQSVADIVHAVQNSPEWAHTAIIITYDENGGRWDHVSPPDNNGIWGDGTRVPAIVISPYAKQGYVDHTEHDTFSILATIEHRFNLPALSQFDANASTLASDFQLTPHVSIGSAYVQPDANTPGSYALIVQGTEGNDVIQITQDNGEIHVQITGPNVQFDHFFAQKISRIEVYGQGGDDQISVAPNVTIPAFLFAGNDNSVLRAGGGPSVLVGGAGNDVLIGGTARDILIAGWGHTELTASAGGSIMIAGTTHFDTNIIALQALEAEWSCTDETYSQEIAHLTGGASGGLNGPYLLTGQTVHSHLNQDTLHAGPALDWFFAHVVGTALDQILGTLQPGEMTTGI
jgi:acid phosphatase